MLVVLTGAEGIIGAGFRDEYVRHYSGAYDLRLAVLPEDFADDRFSDVVRFELGRLESVREAFRGADAVVHLAGNPDWQASFDEIAEPNVVGAYHVLEAARLEGVRRVVLASSIHAVMGYPVDRQVHEHDAAWPDTVYGAAKVWTESLAGAYAFTHGLSCICLRIGGYVGEDMLEELRRVDNPQQLDIVITQADMGRAIHAAVTAPDTVRYEVLHALSDNRYKRLDMTRAREAIGYEPSDDAFEITKAVELGPEERV